MKPIFSLFVLEVGLSELSASDILVALMFVEAYKFLLTFFLLIHISSLLVATYLNART